MCKFSKSHEKTQGGKMSEFTAKELQTLQKGDSVELEFKEGLDGTGEFLKNVIRQLKEASTENNKVSIGFSVYIPEDSIENKESVFLKKIFF